MANFDSEGHVLAVFREKTQRAGGAKPGYNLRREAIEYGLDATALESVAAAFESLVERGVLTTNESGSRIILTEAGAAELAG